MADLAAAETAREGAVTGKTHEDQARAERRWIEWCKSVGIEDYFLSNFSRGQRIRLIGAFAMAVREGRFSGKAYETLAEGSVRNTISHVAQTFRDNDRSNPTKDEDGELGRLLSRQYRAFRNEDPAPEQQRALPMCVLREVAKLQATETQRAVSQLVIGAIFFAARSCEYLLVPQWETRRTKIFRLQNVQIFLSGKELKHNNP